MKKFGFKGRTKYTHLNDQDTTQGNENQFSHGFDDSVKYGKVPKGGVKAAGAHGKRMAGTGAVVDSRKKQKK